MTLLEVYFYMLIILFLIFSFLLVFFSEDLKSTKYFKRYLKITFLIGWLGVLLEIIGWNYLCKLQCILFTFSPIITLLMVKGITMFFKEIFNEEPFHINKKDPIDGIWVLNKWDFKKSSYHMLYSVIILVFPIMMISMIFGVLKRSFC
jgi:hypothetical protein